MFLAGILSWWYGDGLFKRLKMIKGRLIVSSDMFSIGLLLKTLFNPFRQISADASGTSFAEQVRAFFDKLLSRIIGSIVRSFMIVFGSVLMLLQIIYGFVVLLFWLVMPFLPVVGLMLMVIGWGPRWTL